MGDELDTSFTWLGFVNNYVTVNYHDNNILSVSSILLLVAGIPLIWLVIPLMIFNNIVFVKPTTMKRVIVIALYPMGIIISILLGLQILLILVMSSFGQWYIGGPILFLFWSVAFLFHNRSYKMPNKRLLKSTPNTSVQGNGYQQQQDEEAEIEDAYKDEEDDFLHMHDTTAGERLKVKVFEILHNIRELFRDMAAGFYHRKVFSLIMILFIGAISFSISLMSCNMCIAYFPHSVSTSFSRLFLKQNKICEYNQICFSYLTVPQDISSSIISNFQLFGPAPQKAYVLVAKVPFVTFIHDDLENTTDVNINYGVATTHPATCFHMSENPDEERHQCWGDVMHLKPATTYYYIPQLVMSDTVNITAMAEYKFRTGPSLTQNQTVTFTTGGDLQWSESGKALAKFAASKSPLFAMIGGDIAFDNGMPTCYRRWDQWFTTWMETMVSPGNYSIPILTAVGDHEAGGFMRPRSKNAFYLRYFPHQIGLQNINPQERPTHHFHIFSSHTIVIVLDAHVHTHPKDQTHFIKQTLRDHPTRGNNFIIYHGAIYPSRVINTETVDYEVVTSLHNNWLHAFDEFNVSCVFENHFHLYKRTFPLYEDEIHLQKEGTTYLGDGAWGLIHGGSEEDIAKISKYKVLYEVDNIAHLYYVKALHDRDKSYAALGYARVQPWGYDDETKNMKMIAAGGEDIVV